MSLGQDVEISDGTVKTRFQAGDHKKKAKANKASTKEKDEEEKPKGKNWKKNRRQKEKRALANAALAREQANASPDILFGTPEPLSP